MPKKEVSESCLKFCTEDFPEFRVEKILRLMTHPNLNNLPPFSSWSDFYSFLHPVWLLNFPTFTFGYFLYMWTSISNFYNLCRKPKCFYIWVFYTRTALAVFIGFFISYAFQTNYSCHFKLLPHLRAIFFTKNKATEMDPSYVICPLILCSHSI